MELNREALQKYKSRLIKTFIEENRHLRLPMTTGKLVAVADLHGDDRVLQYLLNKFLFNSDYYSLMFLGDYVDREPSSWNAKPTAVINHLLQLKLQYPDRIFMLMGNHELNPSRFVQFYSPFWADLNPDDVDFYSDVLSALPVIATTNNGVALCHGVLPPENDFIDRDFSKEEWLDYIWGDYVQKSGYQSTGRPAFLKKDFDRAMKSFNCNLLVKGHNPSAPLRIFGNRCVTMQTNRFYNDLCGMHIAIVDLAEEIKDANDIEILDIKLHDLLSISDHCHVDFSGALRI